MQYNPQQSYPGGQPYYGQPQQYRPQQYPPQQAPQQYPPQPPVQQYPVQQYPIRQVPVQQYVPVRYAPPRMTPEQQQTYNYERKLRKTVNGLGGLMLVFFGLELVLGVITTLIASFVGSSELSESSPLFLLENGMLSMMIFFVAGLIYCLIKRVSFAEIFPFDKIGAGYLTKLCVIGLSFSLASNYVVDLLNNTFGLFGIENSGGSIDAGSQPNILLYFLTVAILPAFVEEFAFRGIIMGILRPYSAGLAILVSSATFALMHGNFVQLPFTFCCGLVFAYIDIKTNSLLPSIIIHFLNNGLSVLSDVLISYNILTEAQANLCYGVIFAVTGILSFIFLKGIIKIKDNRYFDLENGNDVIPFKSKVKLTVTSPTLITFTVVMILYCAFVLFSGIS
ncbi:MAG: CPBP family intramembrane metalloprotease [Ruminococcus sp.]|uniref:CPBP family intramembrane glutamic endopeptidase n=1 Tax=Ruminococcus sp. TaxID=41978 RepID=UPI002873E61F|nr:type II CAAX endopeptidase family protein [Ruminococcus sp.]MBQ3284945.1 CPBP family intramembrane metalloprotease [Ruminococcus sp.]